MTDAARAKEVALAVILPFCHGGLACSGPNGPCRTHAEIMAALDAYAAEQTAALRAEIREKVERFDISSTFDAKGSYSERKSREWRALQKEILALLAAPEAAP